MRRDVSRETLLNNAFFSRFFEKKCVLQRKCDETTEINDRKSVLRMTKALVDLFDMLCAKKVCIARNVAKMDKNG